VPRVPFPYTNFTDTSGNPLSFGYALIHLGDDGNVPDGLICNRSVLRANLDANGNMITVPQVWNNTSILPIGTYYVLTAYTTSGELVFGPIKVTITLIPQTATVVGTAWPWDPSLSGNAAYPIANGTGSSNGTAPIVVMTIPGSTITVNATGLVKAGGSFQSYGPNGGSYDVDAYPGTSGSGAFPLQYVSGATGTGPIQLVGLIGAFTDSTGTVIQPVAIGSSATLVVPSLATQLQLGTNDNIYADNIGSFIVTVTIISR
jgi:hypothetical protein